jgi:hypothetical protein
VGLINQAPTILFHGFDKSSPTIIKQRRFDKLNPYISKGGLDKSSPYNLIVGLMNQAPTL